MADLEQDVGTTVPQDPTPDPVDKGPAPEEDQASGQDQAEVEDFDQAEHARLLAELAEEQNAEQGQGGEDSTEEAPPQDSAPAPADEPSEGREPEQPRQQGPGPVPYPRFKSIVERAQKAEREAEYLRGENKVLRERSPAQAGTPDPKTPAPAASSAPAADGTIDITAKIKAEKDRILEAAKQFDDGEITASQLEKVRLDADDRIAEMRLAALRPQPTQATPALADEIALERQATDLMERHPYLRHLTQSQAMRLRDLAIADAAEAGKPIPGGVRGTMILRQAVAVLSDRMGPLWFPNVKPTTAGTPTGQQAQGRPAQPGQDPKIQARLNKLQMADGLPPETSTIGRQGATQNDMPSDQTIESMSDDEIAALPRATRDRLMGVSR